MIQKNKRNETHNFERKQKVVIAWPIPRSDQGLKNREVEKKEEEKQKKKNKKIGKEKKN